MTTQQQQLSSTPSSTSTASSSTSSTASSSTAFVAGMTSSTSSTSDVSDAGGAFTRLRAFLLSELRKVVSVSRSSPAEVKSALLQGQEEDVDEEDFLTTFEFSRAQGMCSSGPWFFQVPDVVLASINRFLEKMRTVALSRRNQAWRTLCADVVKGRWEEDQGGGGPHGGDATSMQDDQVAEEEEVEQASGPSGSPSTSCARGGSLSRSCSEASSLAGAGKNGRGVAGGVGNGQEASSSPEEFLSDIEAAARSNRSTSGLMGRRRSSLNGGLTGEARRLFSSTVRKVSFSSLQFFRSEPVGHKLGFFETADEVRTRYEQQQQEAQAEELAAEAEVERAQARLSVAQGSVEEPQRRRLQEDVVAATKKLAAARERRAQLQELQQASSRSLSNTQENENDLFFRPHGVQQQTPWLFLDQETTAKTGWSAFTTALSWMVTQTNRVFFSFTFVMMIPALYTSMAQPEKIYSSVYVSSCTIMFIYLVVGLCGYITYGRNTGGSIIESMRHEYHNEVNLKPAASWMGIVVALMIIVNVFISFALIMNGTLLHIEMYWSGATRPSEVRSGTSKLVRTLVVWLAGLVVWSVPFFTQLVGLVAAFGCVLTQVPYPLVAYSRAYKGEIGMGEKVVHIVLYIFCSVSIVFGAGEAIYGLATSGVQSMAEKFGCAEQAAMEPAPEGAMRFWTFLLNYQFFQSS
ncbi:unnamed protein product [Amoebophrya sp. A25]|nr:unnamed protein product [Amoebophrya sp. A25]|eukprot:GSA25T00024553001.1